MEREIDITSLARDDLESEFDNLQRKYKQLLEAKERDTQDIYDLKRSLATAKAAEQYLAQELEQLTAANSNQNAINSSSQHSQTEYEELRQKYKTIQTELNSLQEDYDNLTMEHAQLRHKFEEHHNSDINQSIIQNDNEKLYELLEALEQQNLELLQKLDEERAEAVKQTMLLAEKDKRIRLVQDELMCVQENLNYKRQEVEEKSNLLESTQEQLGEANAKISQLMSAPENKDRKGNSLFAEVDDQRQAMIKLLAAQKKSYNEMKKVYNESQFEIRRLQRENIAMHDELQTCSIIFRNADRTYQERLVKRISYLLDENEDLKKKLKRSQENLKELAQDRDVPWLNSMLDFCKEETNKLKTQLRSLRIENSGLGEQIRNSQQELARWRFEALKKRCLLFDRESILTKFKIDFKPQNCVEYNITEEEIEKARPRIVPVMCMEPVSTIKETIDLNANANNTPKKPKIEDSLIELDSTATSTISINDSIDQENISTSPKAIGAASCSRQRSPLILKPDINLTQNKSPKKVFDVAKTFPSILCKERDFMAENEKKVQFSANEPTIHILPEILNTTNDIEVESKNSIKTESNDERSAGSSTSKTTKAVFTKSNVVVRSFVIKSWSK